MDNEPVETANDAASNLARALLSAGFPPSAVVAKVDAIYSLPEVARAVIAEQ
jgi:hypothetical protein